MAVYDGVIVAIMAILLLWPLWHYHLWPKYGQPIMSISRKIKLINELDKKLWSKQISSENPAISFVFWAPSGP